MGKFGGFYKGEKKKKKKDSDGQATGYSSAPSYVMPEIIIKKKKEE